MVFKIEELGVIKINNRYIIHDFIKAKYPHLYILLADKIRYTDKTLNSEPMKTLYKGKYVLTMSLRELLFFSFRYQITSAMELAETQVSCSTPSLNDFITSQEQLKHARQENTSFHRENNNLKRKMSQRKARKQYISRRG
eukprot:gb/GECH01009006.1/.p1 GENE.gb/GECH01009006.1/~~gb/GECH01009006.1/.p1  ORF type:complete len:140 (+),score=4.13 gb/GECH01009006.1/:1-420(+)